ncbi:MAG: sulfatase-like hydrolase/transferase [Bryobacteraceae bacterium]
MTPITRRRFAQSSTAIASPMLFQPAPRPNIVLIMADDLGYECLGSNGGLSYRTPNLDRLAAGGVRFEHAYSTPLCTPTRTQLMTGKYTHRNWRAFGILDSSERTFGHMMTAAGYRTCIAGKWQLFSYNPPDYQPEWRGKGMRPEQSGFGDHCLWHAGHTEVKGSRYGRPVVTANGKLMTGLEDRYGEDIFCDHVCDFMTRHAASPFFVYYPMALTHDPFNPTPHSKEWKSGNRLENHTRFFKDMVEYMDHTVGRIVRHLESLKLRERTLLLFYSDNGTHRSITSRTRGGEVGGGKGMTTDTGTRVPLIANWPGAVRPAVLQDLIDSTDFVPTVAELAGASTREFGAIDGRSFLPRLHGRPGNPRDWTFLDFDPRPGWDKDRYVHVRWARDQRFKLYGDGRLFDVTADPAEERPLGPATGAEQRRRLGEVLQRMGGIKRG